jgi:hypothetical protein
MDSMMNTITELALTNLPMVVSLTALVISLLVFIRVSSLNRKIQHEKDTLEKRLRIITSGAVGMGEKIIQLESRLADAVNGQLQAAEVEAQFSYTQALKLIESGVDHSVIMSNSGLSESEVNLMELLHQSQRNVRKERQTG